MSETYHLRQQLLSIARRDRGRTEITKNHAPFIEKYWPATSYPEGYKNREPYCAAAVAYWVNEWLDDPDVLKAFSFTPEQAEKWRCKSAAAFGWINWARDKNLQVMNPHAILHAGDLVVFSRSHIGIVTDDDDTTSGPFVEISANTNAAGDREGEGVFEKPRNRSSVKNFIRLLP